MKSQITFVAFFLLIIGSQAFDFARVERELKNLYQNAVLILPSYFKNASHHVQPMDTKTDILHFAEGFLIGIGSAPMFKNIRECIQDSEQIIRDLNIGVQDIMSKDPVKVKEGLKHLGDAAKFLPEAAQMCKAADSEIKALITLVETFRNPTTFFYKIGRSILINRVEIYSEISAAVDAYNNKDYTNLGYWIGKAMATIILEQNVNEMKSLEVLKNQRFRFNLPLPPRKEN